MHPPADKPDVAYQAGVAVAPRRRAAALHQGMALGYFFRWHVFYGEGARLTAAPKKEVCAPCGSPIEVLCVVCDNDVSRANGQST